MDKKQQIMELWRRCFNDTDEFVRFYFDRKYSDTGSLVYEENSKALSALQMLPYPMSWENLSVTTSYISGACTLPEVRNRGIMALLLQTAFQEMYNRDIGFSTLIPAEDWLFGYYANLGYAPVFDYSIHTYIPGASPLAAILPAVTTEHFNEHFAQSLFSYFERQMGKRNFCIQHPYPDYLTIVEEAYLSGGRLWATQQGNHPTGWALAVPEGNEVQVKEILFDSQIQKSGLLQTIHNYWPEKTLVYKTPPNTSGSKSSGMARVIHVRQMLQHLARRHPDINLIFKLNDPQLQINNGIYRIAGGTCSHTDTYTGRLDGEIDIPSLTEALLGYRPTILPAPLNQLFREGRPYMNLMLD